MPLPPLSYAQRFEDFHLWRCFGDIPNGFYVDIGGGHPVYDNVSFAFYLAGWRGIVAEPNPALAARGVNIRAITTSEIKFSLLIDAAYTELAVRTLHSLYGLDK